MNLRILGFLWVSLQVYMTQNAYPPLAEEGLQQKILQQASRNRGSSKWRVEEWKKSGDGRQ